MISFWELVFGALMVLVLMCLLDWWKDRQRWKRGIEAQEILEGHAKFEQQWHEEEIEQYKKLCRLEQASGRMYRSNQQIYPDDQDCKGVEQDHDQGHNS